MTDWQTIFSLAQPKYDFDSLPSYKWDWPKGTWLQRRLAEVKAREAEEKHESN